MPSPLRVNDHSWLLPPLAVYRMTGVPFAVLPPWTSRSLPLFLLMNLYLPFDCWTMFQRMLVDEDE